MSFIAERLKKVKPSATLAVAAKAKELKAKGFNVMDLGAGEPDFPTPENVKKAGIDAINSDKTRYTAVDGDPALKQAVIGKFKRENGLNYEPNQILIGNGAKQLLFNALMATMNPGDEVIIPAPYWVSYPDMVLIAEGTPVIVECPESQGFKLSAAALEKTITPKTKWLILNSPSNPTGAVYTKSELEEIARVLMANPHVHIMSDDIYEHVTYGKEFYTLAQVEKNLFDRVLTINGVSKSHAMTGWRIGYAGGNPELIKAMSALQSQSTSNACSISQYAAIEALNGSMDFIHPRNATFQKRRDMVVKLFNEIPGIKAETPDGAFYIFASCKELFGKKSKEGKIIQNSADFCSYLIETALVAAVPGSAFGLEGYFRISYATADEVLEESCDRIKKACLELA